MQDGGLKKTSPFNHNKEEFLEVIIQVFKG